MLLEAFFFLKFGPNGPVAFKKTTFEFELKFHLMSKQSDTSAVIAVHDQSQINPIVAWSQIL
jgi:hypothetical protein